jgi:hypothetical protein
VGGLFHLSFIPLPLPVVDFGGLDRRFNSSTKVIFTKKKSMFKNIFPVFAL